MKPVTQTRFGDPEGNCLMAALASVLECDLAECPDLYDAELAGRNWWDEIIAFLRPRGYFPLWLDPKQWSGVEGFIVPGGWSLVSGNSERGLRHMCVAYDGEIRHDPHPGGSGLVAGSIRGYVALVPIVHSGEPPRGTTEGEPSAEILKAAGDFGYRNRGCDERWIAQRAVEVAFAMARGKPIAEENQ